MLLLRAYQAAQFFFVSNHPRARKEEPHETCWQCEPRAFVEIRLGFRNIADP